MNPSVMLQKPAVAPADDAVSFRAQRMCAWSGPGFVVVTGVGFAVLAGFLPPVPPSDTARQVAQRFLDEQNSIRLGLVVALFGGTLLCPWFTIVGLMLKQIAGQRTPWTHTYLMAAAVEVVAFLMPYLTWLTAAFRPDQTAPELTQRLNDLGWIPWIALAPPAVLQGMLVAVVIFQDRRAVPLLPRWLGYLNVLSAISLVPLTFVVFFKTGPLAWNGLVFYLALACFVACIVCMAVMMTRAINRLQREADIDRAHAASIPSTAAVSAELNALRQELRAMRTPNREA